MQSFQRRKKGVAELSHVPHELAEEFPDKVDRLHELKTSNAHFARLSDEYHLINREIHRIESGVEPSSDERSTDLRKQRLLLKDQIAAMLSQD
jgi:uncharacterized protein YdcH (DUF465 family)